MRDRRAGLDRRRSGRAAAAAALVALALAATQAASDTPSPPIPGPARAPDTSGLTQPPAGPDRLPPLVEGPDRPPGGLPVEEGWTHRTWFALGTWWAILADPASGTQRIWGLSSPDGPWVDSGTLVDERPYALLDVAWDGKELVVASTGGRDYRSHALRLHRFGWSASERRWQPVPDHPIELSPGGEPRARLAVTADGTAWLVRPRRTGLEVARTAGRAARWSGWSALPVDAAPGGFDVVAQGEELTIVARRAEEDTIVVTRHRDGTWSSTPVPVPGAGDTTALDAEVGSPDGTLAVLVPVATSDPGAAGDQAPALLLALIPRDAPRSGTTVSVVSRSADGLNRADLLVDGDRARVLALAPPTEDEVISWYERRRVAPTALVEKQAALADPIFVPGAGRRLMSGADGEALARPLLPAAVDPAGGLVVVASGDEAGRWSTWTDSVPPPPQAPPGDADAPTVLVDDTFDALPPGGPGPTAWASDDADAPVGEVVDDPAFGTPALRLAGGIDPVTACRPIPVLPGQVVTVEAVLRPSAIRGTADARVLTVRGSGGTVAAVRVSRLGLAGWSTPEGRVTGRAVPPGAALTVTVRLELRSLTADITVRTATGEVLAEGDDVPWSTVGDGTVDELCLRPAPGQGTAMVVDSVRVTQR